MFLYHRRFPVSVSPKQFPVLSPAESKMQSGNAVVLNKSESNEWFENTSTAELTASSTSSEPSVAFPVTPAFPTQDFVSFVIRDELARESSASPPRRSGRRASTSMLYDEVSKFSKVIVGDFERKAINALLKRLRGHPTMLDNIRLALNQQSPHTPCVTFPKTRDGRMQIGRRKCRPEETYVRIFRFPESGRDAFFTVNDCKWKGSDSQMVCVNPYHYERYTDVGLLPPLKKRRSGPESVPLVGYPDIKYNPVVANDQQVPTAMQQQPINAENLSVNYYNYAPFDQYVSNDPPPQFVAYATSAEQPVLYSYTATGYENTYDPAYSMNEETEADAPQNMAGGYFMGYQFENQTEQEYSGQFFYEWEDSQAVYDGA
ncbi:hypothetical protein QR680_018170 [Steinernema hermaphroditum]|uniref:MH1 domain-containing protein n=1 Tax=Steinernema hermaphroditum TaxID=289476 RepID=A0AA39LQN5_9BILA|nr:hypothetical protein QR680_018170 [Steinernema hermaphroditum]